MNPMTLAEYLKRNGLTREQFARKIKVQEMSVYRYLAGRFPEKKVLVRIIKVTGGKVTADSFLRRAA